VVFSKGRFYQPRLRWRQDDGTTPILDYIFASRSLQPVISEKGEDVYARERNTWYRTSIFGLFSAAGEQQLHAAEIMEDDLTKTINEFPIWLCDDDFLEITDFIGLDKERKKIVFAHTKLCEQEEGEMCVNEVERLLNARPRKSLGFRSPQEVFNSLVHS